MHIMEGYLPPDHAIAWTAASAPFVAYGVYRINRTVRAQPQTRLLLAACGAFAFVLSALKLPSVTGSCSHPTGTGLGAVLFGPTAMSAMATIVLLFQALLLAHGGLTTLGANVFSMGVVGPFVGYAAWRAARGLGSSAAIAIFLAAALSDLATYCTTALQLALAFPDPQSGITGAALKFLGVFAITQVPLAIVEGLVTIVIFNALSRVAADDLDQLTILRAGSQP